MSRALAVALVLVLLGIGPGCGLTCKNFVEYDQILESWVGANLTDYERRYNASPISATVRPRHRHEYKYLAKDVRLLDGSRYYCYDYLEVDDDTGKIVSWRYEGNSCTGHCAD